ncbi:MAG: hypothetical protein ACRD0M_12380, partial [Acidimicrobiales bacterium]
LVAAVVADGGNCTSHCYAGAALGLVSPSLRPLTAVGYGSEGADPPVVAVIGAVAVVLALAVAWWALVGGAVSRLAGARARPSWLRWWLWYLAAGAAVFAVHVALFAVDRSGGPLIGVAIELATWSVLARAAIRLGTDRPAASLSP